MVAGLLYIEFIQALDESLHRLIAIDVSLDGNGVVTP